MKRILSSLIVLLASMMLVFASGSNEAAVSEDGSWTPGGGNVSLIVPFAAGGSSDQVARIIANSGAFPDANVVVENVPGGSCAIGLTEIVQAKPDGFTVGSTGNQMVILPITTSTQPYVYYEEVTPICCLSVTTFALFVRADSDIYTLDDLADAILSREVIASCNSRGGTSH